MIKKYKHVIWDWNGTILDDLDLCIEAGNNLFKRNNLEPLTKEKYKSIFTIPVKEYYKSAGFDFNKVSFEEIGSEWMTEYEERKFECGLHEKIIETMQKIKEMGIGQSVLSAYKQDKLQEMIYRYNLSEYFDYIIGLDNIYASGKAHLAKILNYKLKEDTRYNNGNSKFLMIGDTVHDFEVAEEIGADCILIAAGHQSKEQLLTTKAVVYDNLIKFYNEYL